MRYLIDLPDDLPLGPRIPKGGRLRKTRDRIADRVDLAAVPAGGRLRQGRHPRIRWRRRGAGRALYDGGQAAPSDGAARSGILRAIAAHEPAADPGVLGDVHDRTQPWTDGDFRFSTSHGGHVPS